MTNQVCILTTEIEQVAIRVAQYVRDNVEAMFSTITYEDGKFVVRVVSEKKINMKLAQVLNGIATGIEWQFKHDNDLVSPLNEFYPNRTDHYRLMKNGVSIACEPRTEKEVAEQNAALKAAGCNSEWIRWDM